VRKGKGEEKEGNRKKGAIKETKEGKEWGLLP